MPLQLMGLIAAFFVEGGAPNDDTASASPPRFGPLFLGIGVEEAKAATPGLAWRDLDVSPNTGRVYHAETQTLADIAGGVFTLTVLRDYYAHEISARGELPATTLAECDAAGRAMLAVLEADVGAFETPADAGAKRGSKAISVGARSQAVRSIANDRGKPARTEVEASTLVLDARVRGYGPMSSVRVMFRLRCDVSFSVRAEFDPPPPEQLSLEEMRFLRTPTIAARHYAAIKAAPPPEGLEGRARCFVDRAEGGLYACRADGEGAPLDAQRAALWGIADLHAVDMAGHDRDDPQPAEIAMPVRLGPEDIRPTDFLGRTRVARGMVLARHPHVSPEKDFPLAALARGVESRVTATCEVQTDGSLICAGLSVTGPTDLAPGFEAAALRTLSRYRVEPTLADGAPSAGMVFDIAVDFLLAD